MFLVFPRNVISFISSVERRSITLLTLSTPCVVTCRVRARKKLDVSFLRRYRLERVRLFRSEIGKFGCWVDPEIERCIYCGGEWYHKY